MRAVIFSVACLLCASHARRVQALERTQRSTDVTPVATLGQLLLANNPSGAFIASGPGSPIHGTSRPALAKAEHRRGQHAPVMAESVPLKQKPFDVKDLAGITEPLGFFDPAGFTQDVSEGRIRFYREVELKHGRLGMLAALGFLVAEQWHPLFGGDIDAPSYLAFQQSPLETFWKFPVSCISILEVFSVFTFNSPAGGEPWSIRSDHKPGDFSFDPLKLKPEDPAEYLEMQNKELNNGRLGMLAAAGMIAQELVSGQKLFQF